MPGDLKFLSSRSAHPDLVPAAFPVKVAAVGQEQFLDLAYLHVLPSLYVYYNIYVK